MQFFWRRKRVGSSSTSTTSSKANRKQGSREAIERAARAGTTPLIDALEQRTLFAVLAAPTGLAGSTLSSTELDLTWNDSNGETGYKLERQLTTTPTATWGVVATIPADTTEYIVAGMTPGSTNVFRLKATNADGDSAASSTASVTVFPDVPNVTVSAASSTSMTVSWTAVAGVTGYEVDRSTDGATWTANVATPSGSTLTFSDTGRAPNTVYYYRVRGTNAAGDGDSSSTVFGTTLLAAPTGVTATAISPSQIAITWPKIAGAFGYKLERQLTTTPTVTWGAVGSTISASTNTSIITGLTANTAYNFRLKVTNAGGDSAVSATATTTTLQPAPVLTSSSTATTSVTLNWTNITGTTSWKVEKSTDGGNWTALTTVSNTTVTTTYTDTGLIADTEYHYRLRAVNAGGDSAPSTTVVQTTLMTAPTNLAATSAGPGRIDLAWDAQATATGFKLEQQTGTSTWAQVGDIIPAGATSYSVVSLSTNTAYTFRLKAVNDGGDSAASSTATATTRPSRPKIKGSAASDVAVNLSWPAVTGATSYTLDGSSDGSTWTQISNSITAATYQDTALTANTVYYYRLRAVSAAGAGSWSNVLKRRTLMAAPANVTATVASSSQIDLAWDQSTGNAGYLVEKQVNSSWTAVTTTAADGNSYSATGLRPGTAYAFRVRAVNLGGQSPVSSTVNATTVPRATKAKAAGASTTSISITWIGLPGATGGYEVEQSDDGSTNWTQVATPAAGATSYTDTGLDPDTAYFYRVRGTNAGGDSAWSSVVTSSTLLAAPTTVAGSASSDTQIALTWDAQATAIGFRVERQLTTTPSVTWGQVGGLVAGNATGTTINGLTANTAYMFRVKAVNAGGDSAATALSASVTTKLTAPTLTVGTVTDVSVPLSWAAITGATGYKLEKSSDGVTGWSQFATPSSTTLTNSVTVAQNTTEYYRLRATNAGGDSNYSAVVSATSLLSAPTGLAASSSETTSVDLSWTVVPGVTGYKVEKLVGSTWTLVGSQLGGNVGELNVTGLTAATATQFRVKAVNASGDSPASTAVTATTLTAAPVATAATVSNTAITVTWPAVTGATGFKVERSPDGGVWTVVSTINVGTTLSYADTGLSADTEYFYRVRAVDAGGNSDYSAVTSDTTLLAAPAGLAASVVSSSRVDLSWTAQATATGFKIEQLVGSTWTAVGQPVAAGATSASVTGLTANTAYQFRLKAVNDGGDSAATSAVTATTRTGPTKLKGFAISSTQISLSWTAVTGATGYHLQTSDDGTTWTDLAASLASNVTGYSDTSLDPDTNYWYRVAVTNSGGDSTYSNALRRHTLLAAPANLDATAASASQIDLTWDQTTGNTGYKVERLVGSTWVQVTVLATDTNSYSVTGLLGNTSYTFRVKALDAGGESAASSSVTEVTS